MPSRSSSLEVIIRVIMMIIVVRIANILAIILGIAILMSSYAPRAQPCGGAE